jgi:hypothetical protein
MEPTKPVVLLVTDRAASAPWTTALESAGYTVILQDRADPHTYRWIRDDRPAAIVIDSSSRHTLPQIDVLTRRAWASAIPVITAPAADAPRIAASLR